MRLVHWLAKLFLCNILGIHKYQWRAWTYIAHRHVVKYQKYTQKKCQRCNFGIIFNELQRSIRPGKDKIR